MSVLAVVYGLAVGVTFGLTGAGGGILAVPALVIGLGWSMPTAAPVALLAVAAAAATGAVQGLREGLVRYRAALLMASAGALLSPLGVELAQRLPHRVLTTAFALVMTLVALRLVRQAFGHVACDPAADSPRPPCRLDPASGRFRWTPRVSAILAAIGALAGLLSGLLGVGGGFLIVPALRRVSDVPLHGIVATSLMVIALVSGFAAFGALSAGVRIDAMGASFIAASVAGMLVGRRLSGRLPARFIQVGFAGVCLIVAVSLFLSGGS
nr:sulfite exporter TauE/SafE family protein [Pseudomonas sp. RIT-PI-AD]